MKLRLKNHKSKQQSALESALAEKALSESQLRAIINAEPACVKLVSHDGRLLDMNPAGLAMIGATDRAQVVGHPIIEMVHPDDRDRFLEAHRSGIQRRARERRVSNSLAQRGPTVGRVAFRAVRDVD